MSILRIQSGSVEDTDWKLMLENVHAPEKCDGTGCSVHHPSNHHMRTWPKVWRSWHCYFERQCPHGIGHPDPDDVAYLLSIDDEPAPHSCDGCCVPDIAAYQQARLAA